VITCTRCGFRNEDGATFCRSCSGFLEWSGQKEENAAETEPLAPEPEFLPDPSNPGIVQRVLDRIGGTPADAASESLASPAALEEPDAVVGAPSDVPPVPARESQVPAAAGIGVATTTTRSLGGEETPTPKAPDVPIEPKLPSKAEPIKPAATEPKLPSKPEPIKLAAMEPKLPSKPEPIKPAAPEPRRPAAVVPQQVAARPKAKANPEPEVERHAGDLVCGQCGVGNLPTRKFCRRCGASLSDVRPLRMGWWARRRERRRVRRIKQAGARPDVGRHGVARPGWATSWVLRIFMVLVLLVVVAVFIGPLKRPIRNDARHWSHNVRLFVDPHYDPIALNHANAESPAAPDFAPSNAIDTLVNTSWMTASAQTNPTLTFTFPKTADVAKIGFYSGDQNMGSQSFVAYARPELIHVTFNGSPASSANITLLDTTSFQSFGVTAHNATLATVTILSTYQGLTSQSCALAEVQLWSKN
jgi:ribosomal protein L40E